MSTFLQFLTDTKTQVSHIIEMREFLRSGYSEDRKTAQRIIGNVFQLGSTFTNGLLNYNLDPSQETVLINDPVLGTINMLKLSGKYTVGGVVRLLEVGFGIRVKAFLDYAQAQGKNLKLESGYRTPASQKATGSSAGLSRHRFGKAVDFNFDQNKDTELFRWVKENAAREPFRLFNEISNLENEKNHFSDTGH